MVKRQIVDIIIIHLPCIEEPFVVCIEVPHISSKYGIAEHFSPFCLYLTLEVVLRLSLNSANIERPYQTIFLINKRDDSIQYVVALAEQEVGELVLLIFKNNFRSILELDPLLPDHFEVDGVERSFDRKIRVARVPVNAVGAFHKDVADWRVM